MKILAILLSLGMLLGTACTVIGASQVQTVTISSNGCTVSSGCPLTRGGCANFYWQPTHEVVLAPNQGDFVRLHEFCHAWQGRLCSDNDIALNCWAGTSEGRAYDYVNWPSMHWFLSDQSVLEDAANTCAMYQLDPGKLQQESPERFARAQEYLP